MTETVVNTSERDTPSGWHADKLLAPINFEANTADAFATFESLVHSPEFRQAAARRGHDKPAQVFVVCPGDNSAEACILRSTARALEWFIFADKDGNTPEDLAYPELESYMYDSLFVDQTGAHPVPWGFMHTVEQPPDGELLLPSIADLELVWGLTPEQVAALMENCGLEDLRTYSYVMDILTFGALRGYGGGPGEARLALFRQLNLTCQARGITRLVSVMDEGPAQQMLRLADDALHEYAGQDMLPPVNYRARKPAANRSRPFFTRVDEMRPNPILHGTVLDERIEFTRMAA